MTKCDDNERRYFQLNLLASFFLCASCIFASINCDVTNKYYAKRDEKKIDQPIKKSNPHAKVDTKKIKTLIVK